MSRLSRAIGRRRSRSRLSSGAAGDSSYILTRWLFLRLLGVVYLCAFISLWRQVRGLIGRQGVLPAADLLDAVEAHTGPRRYWLLPTLAWLNRSDRFLRCMCGAGALLSLLLIVGILPLPALVGLWLLYLSLVSVGQAFLAFQWDVLLLEAGFLSIFFAPGQALLRLASAAPAPRTALWLLRWLQFRLMFGSGVVKLASGDPTWRSLTALCYHYETQPLPTPVAWHMHRLPPWFQKLSAGFMFAVELAAPLAIFAPRRVRFAGAGLLAVLQGLIMLSGNYAFFNLLALALCVPLFDDPFLRRLLPAPLRRMVPAPPQRSAALDQREWLMAPLVAALLVLGATQLTGQLFRRKGMPKPLRRLAAALAPFHIVNSYGLFAVMTTSRPEIVVEGSDDGQTWRAYEFRYKPGDSRRAPAWVAPHQPRLDWQMWFAALSGAQHTRWFAQFMLRLLQGAPEVVGLLRTNPFADAPPRYVRATLYDYRFTDATARAAGQWWRRTPLGRYFPPVSLVETRRKHTNTHQ